MKTRIISGAVGVLILAAVLYFHDNYFVLPAAVAVMSVIMLYELLRAVKLQNNKMILFAAAEQALTTPFLYNEMYVRVRETSMTEGAEVLTSTYSQMNGVVMVNSYMIALESILIVFITWIFTHKKVRYEQIFFALAVMILVPQAMSSIVRIERMFPDNRGLFYLIMALCGAWVADTGAYFTGVAIGKHKLCPEISPKKTIEGFIGGILTTAVAYAAAFSIYNGFELKKTAIMFAAGAVCAAVGTLGDLSASMVKRQIGFKDYGKIMPGHGGLMDRFDSVLFVVPTFYVFLVVFPKLTELPK